jgi:peptidyl-prolyl cis-trans isomerase SDCCAG10
MEMFNSFRNKLFKAKQTEDTEEETSVVKQKANDEQEDTDMLTSFFTHKLEADEEVKQKVIDANVADHERYDIYDPRNPLNKRKREESKAMAKEKKSSHQHSHHHHHSSSSSSSNKYSI